MTDLPYKKFENGRFERSAGLEPAPDLKTLLSEEWRDGYMSFSLGELLYQGALRHATANWTHDPITTVQGVEGYLMELNLWRTTTQGLREEVTWEREEKGFWVERLTLDPDPAKGAHNCWYRNARTFPMPNSPFARLRGGQPLAGVEVIVKEKRLNYFITTGEK